MHCDKYRCCTNGLAPVEATPEMTMPVGQRNGQLFTESGDQFLGYTTPEVYGAIGDGVANDTAAFTAMMADPAAVNIRGNGTYKIDGLTFTHAVNWHGLNIVTAAPLEKYYSARLRFTDCRFTAPEALFHTSNFVYFERCAFTTSIIFQHSANWCGDIYFHDCRLADLIVFDGGVNLNHVSFRDCELRAVTVANYTAWENVLLDNCQIYSMSKLTNRTRIISYNTTVRNCYIECSYFADTQIHGDLYFQNCWIFTAEAARVNQNVSDNQGIIYFEACTLQNRADTAWTDFLSVIGTGCQIVVQNCLFGYFNTQYGSLSKKDISALDIPGVYYWQHSYTTPGNITTNFNLGG